MEDTRHLTDEHAGHFTLVNYSCMLLLDSSVQAPRLRRYPSSFSFLSRAGQAGTWTSIWRYSCPFSSSLFCVFITSFFSTPTTCGPYALRQSLAGDTALHTAWSSSMLGSKGWRCSTGAPSSCYSGESEHSTPVCLSWLACEARGGS